MSLKQRIPFITCISIFGAFSAEKKCALYTGKYGTFSLQVDTEVCEQTFSWLSQFRKISRHMNQHRFMLYIVNLCELWN